MPVLDEQIAMLDAAPALELRGTVREVQGLALRVAAMPAPIGAMVRMLMPGCVPEGDDAADALAVAICHAHHAASRAAWTREAVQ